MLRRALWSGRGAIIYQEKQVLLPERLDATFLTSAPNLRRCPPADAPEVAFAGRSNAGKSSVLNQLTGNRRTAKVSKTPGRTQLLNFFSVRQGGRLVDLPGYGYAKATLSAQQQWQKAVNQYLSYRDGLVGLVLVMDIRHPNQVFDQDMLNWSRDSELPIHILLNKADKLGRNAQQKVLSQMQRQYAEFPTASVQCFSAAKGDGKEQLIRVLLPWLTTPIAAPEDSAN